MVKDKVFRSTTNIQLNKMMEKVEGYRGAHPKDWCNSKTPWDEEYLILNLEDSGNKGSHWTAVCNKPNDDYIYYFDSFGVSIPDTILKYMKRSGKQVAGVTNEIQNFDSEACGYYCVNFLLQRKQGIDVYDTLYSFHDNGSIDNDKILGKEIKQDFKIFPNKENKSMTDVDIYTGSGEHHCSLSVDVPEHKLKKFYQSLPKGKKEVYIQFDGDDDNTIYIKFDPVKVRQLMECDDDDDDQDGSGIFDGLVEALPGLIGRAASHLGKAAVEGARDYLVKEFIPDATKKAVSILENRFTNKGKKAELAKTANGKSKGKGLNCGYGYGYNSGSGYDSDVISGNSLVKRVSMVEPLTTVNAVDDLCISMINQKLAEAKRSIALANQMANDLTKKTAKNLYGASHRGNGLFL